MFPFLSSASRGVPCPGEPVSWPSTLAVPTSRSTRCTGARTGRPPLWRSFAPGWSLPLLVTAGRATVTTARCGTSRGAAPTPWSG